MIAEEADMRIKLNLMMLLILVFFPGITVAGDLVNVKSNHDVTETMNRFEIAVSDAGLTVFARVDHQQNAQSVDLQLGASQVLIFGNPKAGTLLMQRNPRIGLALPVKALAWEDDKGQVWLTYQTPESLFHEYEITDQQEMAQKMLGAFAKFAASATGK